MDQYFTSQKVNELLAQASDWLAANGLALEGGLWIWALVQLGVLEGPLPVLGADQADRLLDPDAPANALIEAFANG